VPVSGDRDGERGFTLVEVLIAMGIASLLLGSMYSIYTTSHKSFRVQEQMAEAQQNARGAIQLMTRDIAMAGYSTTPTTNKGIYFANRTSLTMQAYGINGTNLISYSRYSSSRIGRREGGARQAVAERIRRLNFRYKDNSEIFLTPDGSGNVPADSVKQIIISVTAGTPVFGSYSGACTLETSISLTPRNLP
jgi:type IV pilus assembly protein PilW